MVLADKIIDLRKKNGWSQEELGEQLGVSRQAVSKWESMQTAPDTNKILAMAEIFGVSTDYLLTGRVSPREQSNITALLEDRIAAVQKRLKLRGEPFGTEELALLLTAILTNE